METNFQKAFVERCFSLIDEYAPGFSSSVVGYDMLTPPDLEREFGLTGKLFPIVYITFAYLILSMFYFTVPIGGLALRKHDSHFTGGNIFHGAMGLDSLFLMRPAKGW
jgi:phytoene dehydrogenase-like protein